MKKKYFLVFTIFAFFILFSTNVFAMDLKLNVTADKTQIKKDDEITVEVNWEKEMQAADFSLSYNSKKLQFIESDIEDVFLNTQEDGKIKTAWVSLDDTNKTNIKYKFKILQNGKLEFTANVEGGFANKDLEVPDKYKNGKLTIGNSNIVFIIIIITVIVIASILILLKNKKNK